jgi:high frequency lysogenization protein
MHELMAELGKAYADIISGQKPSVIVTGNPQYLDRREIVTEIRALLLAALRGAVLWRQMGGNMLDCLIRRKAMLRAMDSL